MRCSQRSLLTDRVLVDVPWSAVEMEVIGDNESDIRQCAQRLITDDNWRVRFFYSFSYGVLGYSC